MTAQVAGDEEPGEQINIQDFLNFFEKRIKIIGTECIENSDIESKSGLDILSDLERVLDDQLKLMQDINKMGNVQREALAALEKDEKKAAAIERKDKFNLEMKAIEKKKQEEAKKRSEMVHVKIGKPEMFRSKKKVIKKVVQVVKIDEETADRQKYLGSLEEEEAEAAQKPKK
jgi:hypothetical protein